jgi:hypothetical protein
MIAMGMRAHDGYKPLACDRFQDRINMPIAVCIGVTCDPRTGWTRINDRNISTAANEIGLCTVEGEGRGVWRKYASYLRLKQDRLAGVPVGLVR